MHSEIVLGTGDDREPALIWKVAVHQEKRTWEASVNFKLLPRKFTSHFHSDFTGQRKPHGPNMMSMRQEKEGQKIFSNNIKINSD